MGEGERCTWIWQEKEKVNMRERENEKEKASERERERERDETRTTKGDEKNNERGRQILLEVIEHVEGGWERNSAGGQSHRGTGGQAAQRQPSSGGSQMIKIIIYRLIINY